MSATTQTVTPTTAAKARKFELPALDFKFGSLTEGTNIPPPLPSLSWRLFSRTLLNNTYEEGEAHINGNGASNGAARPGSRSASILDEKKAKRSSGWFRRLRSGGAPENASKRTSTLYQEISKPSTPPPPMIPELGTLDTKLDLGGSNDLGSGGLFKNIK
ncbi:unnamed protein product [Parascedosporium putredinis]|uniref:Uncharacterized protein n=1 Tax=Parascedosporium putredinis TaxID=1442378 RepID=A0A9P1M5H2_9PEZI|nr:unnamed protein product [Parascedosporium putredinis]CAI7988074.1 unnamed protein product [Parascedosporium putredinis]